MDAETILNALPALFLTFGFTAFVTYVVTVSRIGESFRTWLDDKYTDSDQKELRDAGFPYRQPLRVVLFHCPRCFSAWFSAATVPVAVMLSGGLVWSFSGVALVVAAWGTVTYTVGAIESKL